MNGGYITSELAQCGQDVSVYTLMKLLGHESMTTSQRELQRFTGAVRIV
jgi:hypothetical protein